MDRSAYPRVAAASLVVLGFVLLEVLNYPDARSDFSPMNVGANLAVLFAVLAAVLLLALFRGHEAGVGISSVVTGAVVLDLVLQSQETGWFVGPLLVFIGGLLALFAYALKVRVRGPVPGQANQVR